MVNSRIYIINFKKLLVLNLPIELRKRIQIEWLNALITPFKELYGQFLNFRFVSIYEVTHNSQVCYLQAALNDIFDKEQRRFKITDGRFLEPLWIYSEAENKPAFIYSEQEQQPVFVYSDNDFMGVGSDFEVLAPSDLLPVDEIAKTAYVSGVAALIDYYKLASKTYNIQWII